MKKFIVSLLLLCATLFAHEIEAELEKVSLQLHWKYQFEFAGFIAAKEKGFYKDVGLDVDLREYEYGINVEDEVLTGRANYGIYNSLTLLDYLKGKDIVLLASYFKRAALVLITTPEIHSPKDLLGKKVMASTKEDFELNFGEYFKGYGVSVDDVILVPHTYKVDKFINGEVSAMTAFISNQPYILDRMGVSYNLLDPSKDNLFIMQLELFTSQTELIKNPKRTRAFIEASKRGWEYALAHKEELAQIIHDKYNPNLSVDDLKKEAEGIQRLILPYTYEIGSIDPNFLKKQKELFEKKYKLFGRKLDNYIYKPSYGNKLNLTPQEEAYIKDHNAINVCVNYDLFPIDGYQNGHMTGEMASIYEIISDMTGLNFRGIPSKSEKSLHENLDKKRCQLLSIVVTESRNFPNLNKTKPFSATSFALLSKLEQSFIDDPRKLKGKTLLIQKESLRDYLMYLYPYLNIKVEYDKNKMVREVLYGKAYGIIALDEQADYIIDQYGYGKLKINGFLAKKHPLHASIGIQKDEPVLQGIIEKALDEIPQQKIENIISSWRINRYKNKLDYSLTFKVIFVMLIIFMIMVYYQRKLRNFNRELEKQVNEKTKELREINESLEATVKEKVAELIQKDELLTTQSKQAVMGEMISMIAHQWRQPLNTITLQISNLQLKEMMGEEIDQKELSKTLENISNAIVYLSNTIDDFKTYFHPNKELTRIKIKELFDRVLSFIEPRAKKANVRVYVRGAKESEINVYVNELIQVLLNLLNNAIDAYEKSPHEKKEIIITVEKKDDKLLISVSDEAGGIKKEHLSRLFEPYFSTKGKNGTGLGLYMSKMIIEKHFGGDIRVNVKDGGTEFVVEIPTNDHSAPSKEPLGC
jgi:signal transduction histidine kinase/ABC-type nitrate/sulfonate/bicarbonate transport system substrate-binding protein